MREGLIFTLTNAGHEKLTFVLLGLFFQHCFCPNVSKSDPDPHRKLLLPVHATLCVQYDVSITGRSPGSFLTSCVEGVVTIAALHPTLVHSWTENYYAGVDDGCVPIDGGLGFLIAGGLGMGVLGVRRRKELELEA